MKKYVKSSFVLIVVGLLFLSGCGNNQSVEQESRQTSSSPSASLHLVDPEKNYENLETLEKDTGISLKNDCLSFVSLNSINQEKEKPVAEAKCNIKDGSQITFRGQKTDVLTDISGIYETYENSKNPTINDISVYEKYNTKKDKTGYAFWYNEKLKTSFSIQFNNWDEEYLKKIV